MVHVGIGYDVHQLVAGRKLVLGGVEIPYTKGFAKFNQPRKSNSLPGNKF
jgi:2C-methyl-D-erythritol 2,4-cyclodiphosphate synthase